MKTGKSTTGSVLANLAGKTLLAAAAFALLGAGTVNAGYGDLNPNLWAEIGDLGNDGETLNYDGTDMTFGGVDYTYSIANFEMSDDKYAEVMTGTGSGTYTPKVNINLSDVKKFANALTEAEHGSTSYNLYTADGLGFTTYSRSQAISDGKLVYAIPTEDEWYKAAYYDVSVGNGSVDNYSIYANGETIASNEPAEGTTGTAHDGWNYAKTANIDAQDVGFSPGEQNGTYDMMGNVWEWMEDTGGVIRGGGYSDGSGALLSSFRHAGAGTSDVSNDIGFRVVAVPEPASGLLLVLVGGLVWFVRRRVCA